LTKDQSYGGLILVVSIVVIVLYLFGLTNPGWQPWLIGVPVVVAVLGILGITAWIGYTMYSTPPPAPLESELTSPTAVSSGSASSTTTSKPEEKK
jgi:hypothetical protein